MLTKIDIAHYYQRSPPVEGNQTINFFTISKVLNTLIINDI
ncbi:hypothetical protein Echvi_2005 [Echinicola vietnamensis DSM 17526]|uniref:Uncharacterized protein n=1 Tax=Echinicola vietnamensis (strain DSM 17526 / LMG 23754 / KMM 6221) TaxID=926556 RepID=L0FYY3_ECHVK|nr:hypothetical protein Echvi_2005 [Echinicola vietnamensis DSM 17526]